MTLQIFHAERLVSEKRWITSGYGVAGT